MDYGERRSPSAYKSDWPTVADKLGLPEEQKTRRLKLLHVSDGSAWGSPGMPKGKAFAIAPTNLIIGTITELHYDDGKSVVRAVVEDPSRINHRGMEPAIYVRTLTAAEFMTLSEKLGDNMARFTVTADDFKTLAEIAELNRLYGQKLRS